MGLIAESLEAGIFNETHAGNLRRLAAETPDTRLRLLDNADWFLDTQAAVPRRERQELLEVLGLHGIALCIGFIDGGRTSIAELRAALAGLTGIDTLRAFLDDLFARRADVLKAATALADLERLAGSAPPGDADWLRRAVERARLDPAMRALATTWAFARVAARGTELPADLAADLRRVALAGEVADMLGLDESASAAELQDGRGQQQRALAPLRQRVRPQRSGARGRRDVPAVRRAMAARGRPVKETA